MIPLSNINFGPTDAAADDNEFLEKLIEPTQISQLYQDKYWIITGEKGSGKTAIRQAIKQKHFNKFDIVIDLDFDKMDYSVLFHNLNQLAQVTDIQRLHLMTDYWQYCLLIQSMRAYFKKHPNTLNIDLSIVSDYLKSKGLIQAGPLRTFLNVIGECWSYVESFTDPKRNDRSLPFLPSDLSPEVVENISNYPMFDPNFIEIRKKFGNVLKKEPITILIILDGFDQFENNHEKSSDINVIFDSLAEAVYSLSIDEYTNKSIKIKALIPNDRFLNIFLRDSDKFDAIQAPIRWTIPNLKQFLSKRIKLFPKLANIHDFHHLWREIMPSNVINPVYNIEEDTCDYLLRHTMYRPRQVQIHLENLSSMYYGETIDPSMIPKAIRESCRKLTTFYIQEYFIDHPNLEEFIYMFKDKTNVMHYHEFRDIVENSLEKFKVLDMPVRSKVNILYTMGFFGVLEFLDEHHEKMSDEYHYLPPIKAGVKRYRVKYYYKEPQTRISASLSDLDLVTIHPLFFDTAKMKPHDKYLIG